MAWFPTEEVVLFTGRALNPSATTVVNTDFPIDGTGWERIRIHLHGVLAAVVTPFADGLYRFLKGITLRTSRGEVLYDSVPGMAVYRLNQFFYHSDPHHDRAVAAGATIDAILDLPLGFPFLNRPEDTYLDTSNYSNVELQLQTGSLDVFAPAAPATCPVTFGISIIRTLSALGGDKKSKPVNHPYVKAYQNIATGTALQWDLESSMDLGLFGFFIQNHDILLVEGAVPFCHPAAGNVDHIATVTFRDSLRSYVDAVPMTSFQKTRKDLTPYQFYDGQAPAIVATEIATSRLGIYPHFFVRNGSVNEQFATGRKSLIQARFTLNAAAGTERADLCVWGQRAMR